MSLKIFSSSFHSVNKLISSRINSNQTRTTTPLDNKIKRKGLRKPFSLVSLIQTLFFFFFFFFFSFFGQLREEGKPFFLFLSSFRKTSSLPFSPPPPLSFTVFLCFCCCLARSFSSPSHNLFRGFIRHLVRLISSGIAISVSWQTHCAGLTLLLVCCLLPRVGGQFYPSSINFKFGFWKAKFTFLRWSLPPARHSTGLTSF
jgi:hypothetical protein